MFEGQLFTVIAVDGCFADAVCPDCDALRFDGLTWEQAEQLIALSFSQGFEVIIWRLQRDDEMEA